MSITNEQLIDPDLALAVFAAARRGIELEKQLSDCRRLIGITDDAPLVEALRLYVAESDEQLEEANKQLGCFRAKAEEEMSQSEQETVNVATCWEVPDAAEPSWRDAIGASPSQRGDKPSEHYIRKARGDDAPDAPESSTAGLLEKINELRMTTARNDTRQEIHRRWLYECRDLLFSEELRAALESAEYWKVRAEDCALRNGKNIVQVERAERDANELREQVRVLTKERDYLVEQLAGKMRQAKHIEASLEEAADVLPRMKTELARRQELIDLHENEIATQRDEIRGLRAGRAGAKKE